MRFLLGLISALPASIAYALARLMYLLSYHVLRYRRGVVKENLAYAFPEKTEKQRIEIQRASYRHFCNLIIEIIRAAAMPQAEFSERMSLGNVNAVKEATDGFEKQAIILLVHQGNWEWMLHAVSAEMQTPVDPVYKTLHNPFWDQYMLDTRSRFGGHPMAIDNIGREVIRSRRRRRLIGMLADQAAPRVNGFWCDYLNRPACFYRGADKLAKALDIPVFFARCRRLKTGYYHVDFEEISLPPHNDEPEHVLKSYVTAAEAAIRAQPETFLWTNRRWKKAPPPEFLRKQEQTIA